MSLIVTGSIGIDTVITPTGRADEVLGGSCTYFAAAASFFSPARIVAAVGEDFPEKFMSVFDHFDVDTKGLEIRAGSKTFRWTGEYHDDINSRDTLDVQLNILIEALPSVPKSYQDSQYVFLANTHPTGQLELRKQFPDAKLVVADTMNIYIDSAGDQLAQVLGNIDGLVLNDSEATQLTGETNVIIAAEKIIEMGPKFVVVKKGEHGCILKHTDGIAVLPAYPAANVIDPTGAGDSFAGGMMGYLACADRCDMASLHKAMAYGTVVASFNIESFTLDRLKQISRTDIDKRLDEFASYINFS